MKVSVKCEYAMRALLGLAQSHSTGKTERVEALASRQKIPPKYLTQILIELKTHGLVRSQRGKEGGYQLEKSPGEITIGQIIRAIQGPFFQPPDIDQPFPEIVQFWQCLQSAVDTAADNFTLQQLLEQSQTGKTMYYI